MPPKRKIESQKVAEADVKGKGDLMEVEDGVKTTRGRGKKADKAAKPDKIVEEIEELPKVKKGQKKEAVTVEEPKARGRKPKAEKELLAPSAPKEKSPTVNTRRRKPKAKVVEEEDESSEEEVLVPKISNQRSPTANKRGRKPKAKADDEADIDRDEPPTKRGAKKATKAAKEPEVEPPAKEKRTRKVKAAAVPKESNSEESEEEKGTKKKTAKQQVKAAAVPKESGDEEPEDEKETKKKNAKQQVKAAAVPKGSDSEESEEEKETKKRNAKQQKVDVEKNTIETNYENIDFSACEKNAKGEAANMKIACWNIGGIRAWLKKDGLQYIINESPDILCLQETKCPEKKLPEDFVTAVTADRSGKYHMYWLDGDKDGYAGVAMFTRTKPLTVAYGIGHEEMDKESRCITAQFADYYVINVYVPNAGRGLVTLSKRLEWNDLLRSYVKALNNDKPVIICGDMNVAHNEIDLKNPKSNKKNAGFTQEERDGMTTFLGDGLVDVYRKLYPEEKDCYTFWSYMTNARNKNVGWRLDYFLVSERFMENVCDTKIRNTIFGSDHCPLTLHFNCDK